MEQPPSTRNSQKRVLSSGAGLVLGIGVGAAIGAAFNNLAIGIAIGAGIGVALGEVIERRNRSRQ